MLRSDRRWTVAIRRLAPSDDQRKYETDGVKIDRGGSGKWPKMAEKQLFLRSLGILKGARDFVLEALGHLVVAVGASKLDALFQDFRRARDVALAEEGAGLSKDTGIAFTFFGGIHDRAR